MMWWVDILSGVMCVWLACAGSDVQVAAEIDPSPIKTGPALGVELNSEAALAWDVDSGEILFEKNSRERRPVASLVKLLTVLTALDVLQDSDWVNITSEALAAANRGVDVELPLGDAVKTRDLISASLVASANDAAVALAVGVAGSETAFVNIMNEKARQLGLANTRAVNATGLSEHGHEQFSSAEDIMILLEEALRKERINLFLSQGRGELYTKTGRRRVFQTTNQLLGGYLPIVAAKTGYTVEAGENVAVITENDQGQRVGIVILGSKDRFLDAKVLAEWVWRNYTWK